MTGKSLSNGTMSLRFMQNAQRAKQEQTVQLQRAKVQDEAEWEVSKEIKEAWGLISDSGQTSKRSLTYEPSYLPFLFPSLLRVGHSSDDEIEEPVASTSAVKVTGRRTFKKGQEVTASTAKTEPDEEPTPQQETKPEVQRRGGKIASALSTKRAAKLAERDRESASRPRMSAATHPGVPVLSMISAEDTTSVGVDLRQLRKTDKAAAPVPVPGAASVLSNSSSTEVKVKAEPISITSSARGALAGSDVKPSGFLRPAGVDSPSTSTKLPLAPKKSEHKRVRQESGGSPLPASPSTADSTDAGQRKKKKKKVKREQEQAELTSISMQR